MTDVGTDSFIEFPNHGTFQLGRMVGSGGSSFVYMANDETSSKYVVKVVRSNASNDGITQRVENEINNPLSQSPLIIKAIDHAIISSFGLNTPCILFDYVFPSEVAEFLTKEQPSHEGLLKRMEAAVKMCEALTHVHNCGYVHGDVSPKNFLLNPETDEVHLIDFETLCPVDGKKLDLTWANKDYMAPEVDQFGPKALSHASDVWSMGLVLVEWLAPQVWQSENLNEGWAAKFNHRKLHNNSEVLSSIISCDSPEGLEMIWPWITASLSITSKARPTMDEIIESFGGSNYE